MISDESLEHVFANLTKSPYMTMAPRVRTDTNLSKRFPALMHFDGTARLQSVGRDDEPWIHALLTTVAKITGLGVLINTSFNTKGSPIVNSVRECLELLTTARDLDYVLIEDWLFAAPVE